MRTMASKKNQPRVPFGALIETGMIEPGAVLTDSKRRWQAKVGADASVEMAGKQGSIHQIGAAAQGAPSCNGWTFWHVTQGDSLVCLDDLRQKYIATLN
jgi:modification methylase